MASQAVGIGPATGPVDHLRFHRPHAHLNTTFGNDKFALRAEAFARFFGTPLFLGAQTLIVLLWVCLNAFGVTTFDAGAGYDFGPGLEAVLADYISKNSPYKPYTDGRITVIAATAPPAGETTEPAAAATAPAAPAAEAPAAASTAAEAAVATAATVYKVVAGDSLWKIAEATYGDGLMWSKIAEANTLRNPNVLSIGRELQLPPK
mgnify:CR=1 FL=1